MSILPPSFYNRPTLKVAQELLGKRLIYKKKSGIITETEAYIGQNDPACHASKGKTKRTEIMFGPAGYSYVYLIYGIYHCLNIVTEKEGFPAAVLIRAVECKNTPQQQTNGPGKLCREWAINKSHNAINMTESNNTLYVEDTSLTPVYETTSRIGIKQGKDLPWRFITKHVEG